MAEITAARAIWASAPAASNGTNISSGVKPAVTRNEPGFARVRRVQVSVVPQRHEQHISQARQGFFARDAAQGPRADHLIAGRHPSLSAIAGHSAVHEDVGPPWPAVEPAEPRFAAHHSAFRCDFRRDHNGPGTDVHLAVVGGDAERGALREYRQDLGNQAVGEAQLGTVELSQARCVRDFVDSLVVGVDKRFAFAQQAANEQRDAGGQVPADFTHPLLVCLAETRTRKVRPADHGHLETAERRPWLDNRWGQELPRVTRNRCPTQDVEHFLATRAVHEELVAEDPVLSRCHSESERG